MFLNPSILLFLILVTSFILGLIVVSIVHIFVKVFFFSVILGVLINYLLLTVFLKKRNYFLLPPKIVRLNRICISMLSASLLFSFLMTVPVNVDRSFSIWMLSYIEQVNKEDKNLEILTLKSNASNFFSPQSTEIDRRIKEQSNIRSITVDKDGFVRITFFGSVIIETSRIMQKFFGLNSKYTTGLGIK